MNTESVVQRYLAGTSSTATKEKYKQSIDAVTESPMAKAAAADELYLKRVEESVRSGRRAAKLNATPISRWKDNAKGKGADRLSTGAAAAADKVRAHFAKWGPVYDQIKRDVAGMAKGGIEESLARVRYAIEASKKAAGKM
jgi:hypothetical protein